MKRLSVLTFAALALCINACEKHPASELPPEHATEFGEHSAHGHAAGAEHGAAPHAAAPAEEHGKEAAHAPAPAGEAKPGESPKFLPENK